MSVRCAQCGEEILGAVNRCWRCGRAFEVTPPVGLVPPVRRAPVTGPLDVPPSRWLAEASGAAREVGGSALSAGDVVVVAPEPDTVGVTADGPSTQAAGNQPTSVRRGSPFRLGAPTVAVLSPDNSPELGSASGDPYAARSALGAAATPVRSRQSSPLATAATYVALVLTILALLLIRLPPLLLGVAILAVPLALWGLAGRDRRLALVVLLLTCLVLTGGLYGTAMWWYLELRGAAAEDAL